MRTELYSPPPEPGPEREQLLEFMAYDDQEPGALAACREAIVADARYDRDALAALLADYTQAIGGDQAALANCRRLRQPDATVIVTGQQAGLFSGPLYTVYKAATAINLARDCEAKFGSPVAPVFWNATEDHDLSEIASCHFPERTWRAAFPEDGQAAERLQTEPAVRQVVAEYLETIGDDRRAAVAAILDCDQADYGRYSSAVIARLFSDTGLIVMEPRLLRAGTVELVAEIIRRRDELVAVLRATGERLRQVGVAPAFDPQEGFGLFHINASGVRRQVLERDGKLGVDGAWLDEAELLYRAAAEPERFSVGAFLRPVVQSRQLPNMAFVAGPSEWRYHLQLLEVFKLFQAQMPVVRHRNHATILTPREQRLAAQLGLGGEAVFGDPQSHYNAVELPPVEAASFAAAEQQATAMAEGLASAVGELVGDKATSRFGAKIKEELGKLEKRATREYARLQEVDNARVDRFFGVVRPRGVPQERVLNVLYFVERDGPGLVRDLLDCLDPNESRHYLLYTGALEGAKLEPGT